MQVLFQESNKEFNNQTKVELYVNNIFGFLYNHSANSNEKCSDSNITLKNRTFDLAAIGHVKGIVTTRHYYDSNFIHHQYCKSHVMGIFYIVLTQTQKW